MTPGEPKVTAELSDSNKELLETLNDIEAFFRKEHAYEVENLGDGGSLILAGRWNRYFMALYNLAHDLPELIQQSRERTALSTRVRELEAALRAASLALECKDDMAHFCSRCDNSLYRAKAAIDALLPQVPTNVGDGK